MRAELEQRETQKIDRDNSASRTDEADAVSDEMSAGMPGRESGNMSGGMRGVSALVNRMLILTARVPVCAIYDRQLHQLPLFQLILSVSL